MKIGILTITPSIGFGGIMQSYALKTLLENLTGAEVSVISYVSSDSFRSKIRFFLKAFYKAVFRCEYVKFSKKAQDRFVGQNTIPFIEKYLNVSESIDSESKLHVFIDSNFDAVVFGSDQIWRPKYVLGISNYFGYGISEGIKRIAYAASFGVGNWEYDAEQTAECRQLISKFDYVSVREQSGVRLIKEYLAYSGEVFCDLDPTLLLTKEDYEILLSERPDKRYVFSYVLDSNEDKNRVGRSVGDFFKEDVYIFNTNAENPHAPLKKRVAPRVEEWISGIYYSDFVVTDSFHGCLFSIIFNKPFLVYVNRSRGAERFVSILSQLGLSQRMIFESSEYNEEILQQAIDWNEVNRTLSVKRIQIIQRLRNTFCK